MNAGDFWRLPPTVGEIHEGAVCILFSCASEERLLIALSNLQGQEEEFSIHPTPDLTRIVLDNLRRNTSYFAKWYHQGVHVYSHQINTFDTYSRYLFVSCDHPEADIRHSMWHPLEEEVRTAPPGNVQMIHLGDQVYMDACFHRARQHFSEMARSSLSRSRFIEPVLRDMSNRYCQTWSTHPWILSNCSHLMLWDDHEVTNDYSYQEAHSDVDRLVAHYSQELYAWYQENLHLQPVNGPSHSWYKVRGDCLVMAIERTARTVTLDEIFHVIQMLGLKISSLLLCFSSAPVPCPRQRPTSWLVKEDKFWDTSDLVTLYRFVLDWLETDIGEGKRKAIIVGGDLHLGYSGRVSRGPTSFPLVIASPITNHPSWDRKIYSRALRKTRRLGSQGEITVRCLSSQARRCYCVVDVQEEEFQVRMAYARESNPRSWRRYLKSLASFAGYRVGTPEEFSQT